MAGVDTGGTGSFSTGRITGFGSVIVNGVRYEDNAARIVDEDGDKVLGTQDLRLGMVVSVRGGSVTPGTAGSLPLATATTITVESQIKGPVESRTAPDTLVVFGQTVKVDAATVFEGTSFAGIAIGDVLEVSGFAGAGGVVTASRIEREDTTSEFKVRGFVTGLDTAARSFRVGTATFAYAGTPADRLPDAGLAEGQFVRVRTSTTPNAGGQWLVTRVELRSRIEDCDESEVEGILLQSGTSFSVNGVAIDVSRLPAGTVLPVGLRVEVEGAIANNVLVARRIELDDGGGDSQVDARGTVSSVNLAARTFVVRGVTFHYTPGLTQEKDGTLAASLVNGATVRARGQLTGSGTVEASEIDFQP
ncbi:hypothetical protein ASG30_13250 [Ramlibacter sp. Leaf400]|nr:hypothetical protein ASG30_13250 [Ramlibacter sp. Leaf400]